MRYIIEFIALLGRIFMFEDKTQTLHCKLHVLALITCGAIALFGRLFGALQVLLMQTIMG